MIHIISGNCTGKTRKLIELAAKDPNSIIVCKNPAAMMTKVKEYGYYIEAISYNTFDNINNPLYPPIIDEKYLGKNYYVDELEELLSIMFYGNVVAYTLTNEDT